MGKKLPGDDVLACALACKAWGEGLRRAGLLRDDRLRTSPRAAVASMERLIWLGAFPELPFSRRQLAEAACGAGNIELAFFFARQQGQPIAGLNPRLGAAPLPGSAEEVDPAGLCAAAARGGRLDVLTALREVPLPWDLRTCKAAAQNGHLEVLQWARAGGAPWNGYGLIRNGLRRERVLTKFFPVPCRDVAWLAAAHGHVELLRWALDHGLNELWNPAVCRDKAAATGQAEVLEFLVGERGVPLHSSIMTSAGWGGAVAVLEWGKAKGLAVKPAAATGAARNGHLAALKWLTEYAPDTCYDEWSLVGGVKSNSMAILQWMVGSGAPLEPKACAVSTCGRRAGRSGRLTEKNSACCLPPRGAKNAARLGRLDALKYLRDKGCPWTAMTCALAARHGHLEVLQWAIRNHAPFSADDLIQIAEKYEQDGVLRWLAANVASFY